MKWHSEKEEWLRGKILFRFEIEIGIMIETGRFGDIWSSIVELDSTCLVVFDGVKWGWEVIEQLIIALNWMFGFVWCIVFFTSSIGWIVLSTRGFTRLHLYSSSAI